MPQPKQLVTASHYEVGQARLDQVIPTRFRARVSPLTHAASWSPLMLGVLLAGVGGLYWPAASSLAALYCILAGALPTVWLLIRLDYRRAMLGMTVVQTYARDEVAPALVTMGVLVTPSQAIRLVNRQSVELAAEMNLYHANNMRLIRLPDGTDAVQFERL